MNKLPFIKKGYVGGVHFQQSSKHSPEFLLFGYIFVVACLFFILLARLFQLTIVRGAYFRRLAEQNRIRELLIEPRRGTITDAKGTVLAANEPADIRPVKDRLTSSRIYHSGEAFAHLIGYRQIADINDLKNDNCLNKLTPGDKVGKKGAEDLYECQLRGRPGKKLVEVDAQGKYVQTLSVLAPQDGQTIHLAVDADLQKKAYDLIKDKHAAVVGMRPQTGEVLVFASTPSFDPQQFEDANSALVNNYLTDDSKPLFDRATEGAYPPGSIFKLVVATGALEEKKITPDTQIEDTGEIQAGPLKFGNWYFLEYGKTEGQVDIIKAIRRSNDIFFYQTGAKLGADGIARWAEQYGYGQSTGIGFPEASGLVPSPFWKKDTFGENWYLGDTYNFAIGQGYTLVTPIQVAQVTQTIANNGEACHPQLLKTTKDQCHKLPISQQTLDLIKEGMTQACSPGGTGWPLFNFAVDNTHNPQLKSASPSANLTPIQTACKTGTAESSVGGSGAPHAWFTVYAPAQNPQIVLTILVEQAGQGSDIGGPIAKELLRSFFERKASN